MIIERFLNPKNLTRMKNDFKFLTKMIQGKDYMGEFDLALRDNYFNLYYKGNSLAKVVFSKGNSYKISINEKFFSETSAAKDNCFPPAVKKGAYSEIGLNNKLLHPFFKKKYIKQFISKIRKVNNGEEITLEQAVISDNLEREELIIIDRQIADKTWKRRMDLLALVQVNENEYSFRIIEVKLGNNPELKNMVVKQLNDYISHIDKNFDDYKNCYEEQYKQKKELNLFSTPKYNSIKIVRPVEGMIVILGYSGIAKAQIDNLRKNNQALQVKQFKYYL